MSQCKVSGCGKSGRLCPGCVAACMYAEYGQQATHEARCGTFYEGLCQRMAASACHCETLAATVRMYRDELAKAGSGGQYKGHPVSTEVLADITALQRQVRHLQAELQASEADAALGVAVATAVAPCFRPGSSPSQTAIVELVRKRCVGHRVGRTSPVPSGQFIADSAQASTPPVNRGIERLESRLNLHSKRISSTQNWLALSIVATAITGFVLVKHLVG